MRVVIAGGTGLLGRALSGALAGGGHGVIVLSRNAPRAPDAVWPGGPDPIRTFHWSATASAAGWGHVVDGADAVVNLAGESIASGRWTPARKAALETSRIESTRGIVAAIAGAADPPAVLVGASAVGYYGDRGDEVLPETAPPGTDFLAGLSVRWEAAARNAASARTRVVCPRSGLVLTAGGGALARMTGPFRAGVGGRLGSGRQFMPWIHLEDWVSLVLWLLEDSHDGAYNAVAPNPVTNAEFTRALGAALRRPAVLPAPAFALRIAFGEMADALMLSGQRVVPERALSEGFRFKYDDVETALRAIFRS